ncbi:MAG: hypothetical protein KDD62_03930, partial [Bdellovibrionales bacterium]|nr:hypothetical protein [Bdellovibrionales bacterium]
MSKACANYDPKLTYRLTGRACIHHEREYQINYFMNSAGLRGTEESLTAAQIIAIGDSYSFG